MESINEKRFKNTFMNILANGGTEAYGRGISLKLANYAYQQGLNVMILKGTDSSNTQFFVNISSQLQYWWNDSSCGFGYSEVDEEDYIPYDGKLHESILTEKDDNKMNESKNNAVVFIDASSSMLPYQDAARRLAARYDTDMVFYFADTVGTDPKNVGYGTGIGKVVKYIKEHPNYNYVIVTDDDPEIRNSALKNLPNVEIVDARTAEDDQDRELAIKDAEKNISDEQKQRNRSKIAKLIDDDKMNEDMSVRAKLKALYPELDFEDKVEEAVELEDDFDLTEDVVDVESDVEAIDDDMDFDLDECDEQRFMETLYNGSDFDAHDDEEFAEDLDCEDDECWENDLISDDYDDGM